MQSVIPYLKKIKKNNNKVWFDEYKPELEIAKKEFLEFVKVFLAELKKFDKEIADLEPEKTIFRIYRDVRFSKDKTPYKTHFGCSINPGGKKTQRPGYYLHVQDGECFICAGIHLPEADDLKKIRQEIDYHFNEVKKIISDKTFKKNFKSLYDDDKMVNPPKGFDKENPAIEILKLKSFIGLTNFDQKILSNPKSAKQLATILKSGFPLLKFLRRAIS